jgi:hypothetical protein
MTTTIALPAAAINAIDLHMNRVAGRYEHLLGERAM